jgi:hypothetical protein
MTAVRRQIVNALLVAVVLAGSTGCHGHPQPPPPAPQAPARPLVDTAPYWCRLAPQAGVWQVTGATPATVVETHQPTRSGVDIDCGANSIASGKLVVGVDVLSGRLAQREAGQTLAKTRLRPLPKSLGDAWSEQDGDEWSGYALFRCGATAYWLLLYLNPIPAQPDARADLVAMMGIAQRRWASLARCTLDPAHPPARVPNRPTG